MSARLTSPPDAAAQPIRGGSAPTTAPNQVFISVLSRKTQPIRTSTGDDGYLHDRGARASNGHVSGGRNSPRLGEGVRARVEEDVGRADGCHHCRQVTDTETQTQIDTSVSQTVRDRDDKMAAVE